MAQIRAQVLAIGIGLVVAPACVPPAGARPGEFNLSADEREHCGREGARLQQDESVWNMPPDMLESARADLAACRARRAAERQEEAAAASAKQAAAEQAAAAAYARQQYRARFLPVGVLIRDYRANEVAADQRYKGRTFDVIGRVHHVGRAAIFGAPFVELVPDGAEPIGAQCVLAANQESSAAALGPGDEIVVRGRGAGLTLGIPMLLDCVIAPAVQ